MCIRDSVYYAPNLNKKTQTEIWVKFFLVVCETVVTLSYTIPNSWALMIGHPFSVQLEKEGFYDS